MACPMRVFLVAASALIALAVGLLQWRAANEEDGLLGAVCPAEHGGHTTLPTGPPGPCGGARSHEQSATNKGAPMDKLTPAGRGGSLWFLFDSFSGRYLYDAWKVWRAAPRVAAKRE
mmetsp:Transcript_15307/g.63590  ORF Transcript_15307/g.63590 Transcript_15307/m.63590 type:complete len:117 (-) Transcript_15307:174-524(-)